MATEDKKVKWNNLGGERKRRERERGKKKELETDFISHEIK